SLEDDDLDVIRSGATGSEVDDIGLFPSHVEEVYAEEDDEIEEDYFSGDDYFVVDDDEDGKPRKKRRKKSKASGIITSEDLNKVRDLYNYDEYLFDDSAYEAPEEEELDTYEQYIKKGFEPS